MKRIKTGIVVLNYNDFETTDSYINLIQNYKIIDYIIVVDNCSTDQSYGYLKNKEDEVSNLIVLKADFNNGYAAGNNIGVKYGIKKLNLDNIIISNPDIYVSEESIMKMLKLLDKGYSLCTGIIYNYDKIENTKKVASNYAWRIPTFTQMLVNTLLFSYKISRIIGYSNYLAYNDIYTHEILDVEAVPGCFFCMTAKAFEQVNYFDERTFLFGEETILGYKMKQNKLKACVLCSAKVFHENSVTINKNIKTKSKKIQYLFQSNQLFLTEYLHVNKLQIIIYKIFFRIGIIEKSLITYIRNIRL